MGLTTEKCLLALLLAIASSPILSQEGKFSFIDELIKDKDLFRAVTQLKEGEYRHRHRHQNQHKGLLFGLKLLRLYVENNEFELADTLNDRLKARYKHYKSKDHLLAKAEILYLTGSSLESQKTIAKRARIKGPKIPQISKVLKIPSKVIYLSHFHLKGPHVLEGEDRAIWKAQVHERKKSKALAMALSIIPGFGQMYIGNFQSGLPSLVINILALGTSFLAFKRGEKTLGQISGLVGLSFYASNFYATSLLTDRYNASLEDRFRHDLNKKYKVTFKIFDIRY